MNKFWKNIRLVSIVLLISLLSGCISKRHITSITIVKAEVRAIDERIPIRPCSKGDSCYRQNSRAQFQVISAKVHDISLHMGLMTHPGSLSLAYNGDKKNIKFMEEQSFYQLNDESRLPFNAKVEHRPPPPKYSHHTFVVGYDRPEPIRVYRWGIGRKGLSENSVRYIRDKKRDIHRLYFAFNIDEESFEIDISFKVGVKTKFDLAIPATP